MFNLKKIINEIVEEVISEKFKVCNECGGVFYGKMMQTVKGDEGLFGGESHYCQQHKKPYDKYYSRYGYSNDGKCITTTKYFKQQVEVDKNGKIITK